MRELLTYGGIATKIRAMEGHFLSDQDFEAIVRMHNVGEVTDFLAKQPGYSYALGDIGGTEMHREQLESLIGDVIFLDHEKLYRFADSRSRKILRSYGLRFEARLLKGILGSAVAGTHHAAHSRIRTEWYRRYCSFSYDEAMEAASLQDITPLLKGTPSYEKVRQTGRREGASLFDYETAIDLAYFSAIWKEIDEMEDKETRLIRTVFYGTRFDMLNLWYIYRAKHYFRMNNVDVYALTIPELYRLKRSDIQSLVEADSPEAFEEALRGTWYGKRYPELHADNLQYMYTRICKETIAREAREKPYSAASLYYYLYWKEHELYRLTTAIECVRYSLPPAKAIEAVMRR